jgi:NitT/TauT family transport system substrate-binding protein
VSWPAQNNQDWHWLLITKESMTQSPEPIIRFLRALMKAEYFLLAHEEEAKGILVRKWNFEPEFMQQIWDKTRLNIAIDQYLILSLENFARWRMNKEGKSGDVPNFINYIYTGALDEIDPRAVRIFR